jgi:hypothetical protein
MTDLFTAFYTRYLGTTLAGSLTALYTTMAPEGAVFPYGVYSLISVIPGGTFTEDTEDCLIQFNLFSKTVNAEQICDLFEKLKTGFDYFDLNVPNYTTISVIRENAILTQVEKVWQYSVLYRIFLGKN